MTGAPSAGDRADPAEFVVDRVEAWAIALPAVRPLEGPSAPRILVKVTAGGVSGWGEATPARTCETAESILTTIRYRLAPVLVGRTAWDLDGITSAFDQAVNRGFTIGAPLAKAAVDMAVHDLLGRALGLSLGVLWGARRTDRLELGWTVAGQSAAEAADSVAEGLDHGYRAFKVDLGGLGRREDARIVEAVRAAASDAVLWADGNQSYTVDSALRVAGPLADVGATVFEQPLPANDIAGLKRLRDASPVPIALDESLPHPSDLATFIRLDAVDVVVAKVQRSGGLTLSRRLCGFAEDCGTRLMGSGVADSDLGLAASLHLFAAYDIGTPVDLAGRQFVRSPYATGRTVTVVDGAAEVPTDPGLGVDVDEQVVRSLAVDLPG
ncbi:enolase C-terminal domain-like protein [Amycolatopsis mediterranei]|uniref:mandelate racemase/muconate lactonizing enzyme family protein n=1 Tax=Amycolatopsis mediterranei TaxID=33910 RepID=UPI003418E36D